jgi:hypothetical protein
MNKTTIKQLLKDLKWAGKDSSKLFNLLAGINRPIVPSHVTKISTSIQRKGNARPVIIVRISFIDGTPKDYIIDGQHLFFALLRNNMDIPYVVMDVKDKADLVETIALLNSSSKSWTTMDYISAWASVSDDYKVLADLYNTYDLETSQIAELLHTGTIAIRNRVGGSGIFTTIKKGEFKILDKEDSIDKLNKIQDVLKVVPRMDRTSNSLFISSYTHFITVLGEKYNHEKFLAYLHTHKSEFVGVTQDPEQIQSLLNKSIKTIKTTKAIK